MVVTLEDGNQQLILIDIKDGIEKSRKYIKIKKSKIKLKHYSMTKSDIFIEKLRERLSIIDIIGKKVNWDLKKVM